MLGILLLVLVAAAAAGGCARYELQGDGQGRLVRLDRLTGQVAYLQGKRLVAVENPGDRRRALQEIAAARDWGAETYDKYRVRLRTSWRGGRMYYQIGISPTPPLNVFNFRIALLDAQAFEVGSISLNVPDGVPTAGGIIYTGVTHIDEEAYREIRAWKPRVEFFSGRLAPAEELPLP